MYVESMDSLVLVQCAAGGVILFLASCCTTWGLGLTIRLSSKQIGVDWHQQQTNTPTYNSTLNKALLLCVK